MCPLKRYIKRIIYRIERKKQVEKFDQWRSNQNNLKTKKIKKFKIVCTYFNTLDN